MSHVQATIITIGDELLIGQTIDTNSAWMGIRLNQAGIAIRRRIAVGDNWKDITDALDEEIPKAEIILITGGLGPTADDITKPCLNAYFGGKLIVNLEILEAVRLRFEKRDKPFLERNAKQAEVPDVCTVLQNTMGTAPGMWFEKDNTIIVSLPGVPFEMIGLMEKEVMPRLQERFHAVSIVHRNIMTAGEGESFIAERIQELEIALPPHIRLAYLPHLSTVRLRLSGSGLDELALITEIENHRNAIASKLEDLVVSLEDLPLEHILGKLMVAKRKTLALAESCTGGFIAHKLTSITGASAYFQGSLVCYQEAAKENVLGVNLSTIEKNTVVSEAVALEMAEGARNKLKGDIGFGITGKLSESPDYDVTVGTVCMAVCDKNKTFSKTFLFHHDRQRNNELAVQNALLLMWRFLMKKL